MRKSSDRHRTDQKFDHKQHKRTHSSCAEIPELELRRSGTYPCGWFSSSAVVGLHIPVTELILRSCERDWEDGARYLRELEFDTGLGSDERGKSRVDESGPCRVGQSRYSSTAGLEETVWSELRGAVYGSGRGNGRNHDDKSAAKTVEKSVLRLRRGLEDWIFPQGKAARRENPDADALWCMCQSCSTILWLRRNRRCTRARAARSLLPSLAAAAVWEKKCVPNQFNEIWALVLLQMRSFLVPTTEETKKHSMCVHMDRSLLPLHWFCMFVETRT